MLARANNFAISLAVLGKCVGATTVECCGQRIMITCGRSGGPVSELPPPGGPAYLVVGSPSLQSPTRYV